MIVYRIGPQWQVGLEQVEEALGKAVSWNVAPRRSVQPGLCRRGRAAWPAGRIGGRTVGAAFMVEAKVLPGSVLARKVQEKTERIEQETGRKPGKKESKELKEEAKLDLLPMAFTKQGSMWVWIDCAARTLVLDTSSQAHADEVVSSLVELLPPGFAVALLNTQPRRGRDVTLACGRRSRRWALPWTASAN